MTAPEASGPNGDGGTDEQDRHWRQEQEAFAREDAAARENGDVAYPGTGRTAGDGPSLGLLGSVFAELSSVVFDSEPDAGVAGLLTRVVDAGLQVLPSAEIASVTLRRAEDEGYSTPVQSHAVAAQIDQVQYDHGEGPCVTALEAGGLGTASSDDLAAESRWSRFGPAAAALGASSVFSVGLFPVSDGRPLRGALNFYRGAVGGFTQADREAALLLAAHASVALAHIAATDEGALREEQFRTALDSRDVIGQAKGILMERRGISAEEAFTVLRRASQDLNVKLHTLAGTLAARRSEL